MKMITKSAAQIAAKWGRVTPERVDDYSEGVRNPRKDWEKNSVDSEDNYQAALKESFGRNARVKGIKKVGTAGQIAATIEKGISRWPEGVRVAESKMASGMEFVVRAIESVKERPKYPKGDPRNLEIVKDITQAIHKAKIAQ